MESIIYAFTDKSIQLHYSNALYKIKSVLRYSQKEKLEKLTQNIKLQVPPCFRNDYEYLSLIQQAISEKTILKFDYKNNKEAVSKRHAEPIGLIFYAMGWHLVAWCHIRKDYRDFKIARIVHSLLTPHNSSLLIKSNPITSYKFFLLYDQAFCQC